MQSNCFSVAYESSFNGNYLRNNKCDGEKNIRCFPQCCSSGHCKVGFCGSSVRVILTAHGISSQMLQSLIVMGELLPDECQPSFLEEPIITQAALDKQAKYSKYYTTSKILSLDQQDSVHLQFNTNPKSWGYSYVGHRFKKNQKHKFVVSVLTKTSAIGEEDTYRCLGAFDSESFNMQCKRRAKTYSPTIDGTQFEKSTESTMTTPVIEIVGSPAEVAKNVQKNILMKVLAVSSDCTMTMITDTESPITTDILIPLKENTTEPLLSAAVDHIISAPKLPDNSSKNLKEHASNSFDISSPPNKSPQKDQELSSTGRNEFSPFVHFYPILSPADVPTSISIACSTISVTDSAIRSKPKAAPWPVDTPSNPFGSVGSLDHWCPSYEDGKISFPKATHIVSSRRMAMMQQLFPKRDITLFYQV